MKLGAIEGGGTKFLCGVGTAEGQIIESISISTTTPEQTLGHVIQYFAQHDVQAIGFGSFGPVEIDPANAAYGSMLDTPKPHWSKFPMLAYLKTQLAMPIVLNTDVNMAVVGEATWGAAAGLSSCLYMTIGTGIGAGAIVNEQLVHGFMHPEMGHMLVRRHEDDTYAGACPFHHSCLEGLAAGLAIEHRWGKQGASLGADHLAWEYEAYYIAQAIINAAAMLAPKKVIVGGGVMRQKQLLAKIRQEVLRLSNRYWPLDEQWIVPPKLGEFSALKGALAVARTAV